MKRKSLYIPLLLLLVSCGSKNASDTAGKASEDAKKNTMAFTSDRIYVNLSELPERFSFPVDTENAEITRVAIGSRVVLTSSDYEYKDGILSIKGSVILNDDGTQKITAGDQKIRVVTSAKTITKNLFVVTKVIKTAEDLVSIGKDIDSLQGAYILGNDIDCSSISNFEPLGYADTNDESSTHFNMQFNGVLDGNGYSIKNVSTHYNSSWLTNKDIYDGTYVFSDLSHRTGNEFGLFQEIGAAGIVRNLTFSNIDITGRTIVGAVCGVNNGTIENVLVDSSCSLRMSTHFYDESCAMGGIAGINGTGTVNNCISLVTDMKIADSYTDYDDVYLETEKDQDGNPINYHVFYNGNFGEGKEDSNGKLANNIYSGVGLTYATVSNSFGLSFTVSPTGLSADFSQTHLENRKSADGPDIGSIVSCQMKTEAELKDPATYSDVLDTDIWNLKNGLYPTFKAIYPYTMK